MAWLPAWVKTLGAMIDDDARIQVRCNRCLASYRFSREDLEALAAKVGRDYSLVNRRCRCRLTQGCTGWNKFDYQNGVYRPLADSETLTRWHLER